MTHHNNMVIIKQVMIVKIQHIILKYISLSIQKLIPRKIVQTHNKKIISKNLLSRRRFTSSLIAIYLTFFKSNKQHIELKYS